MVCDNRGMLPVVGFAFSDELQMYLKDFLNVSAAQLMVMGVSYSHIAVSCLTIMYGDCTA